MINAFNNLRLATKLGVVIVFSSAMGLCILCAAFLAYDLRGSRISLENHLSTLAAIVGENSAAALEFRDPVAASDVLRALHSDRSLVSACLYDGAGKVFSQYLRSQAAGARECPTSVPHTPRDDRYFIGTIGPVIWNSETVGTVYLQSDLVELKYRWDRLARVAVGLLIASLIVGSLAGWLLLRRVMVRISELAQTMRVVSQKKDYGLRIPRIGNDEIGQLTAGFNEMLTEIEIRDDELQQSRRCLESELEERTWMNEELRKYREDLEVLVHSRTIALETKEEQLRLLLESTAEAITGIDLEGKYTFCNPAWLRMFGYENFDDVVGRDMHELVHHHTREGKPITAEECGMRQVVITGRGTHADDEVLWRADGTYFPAEYWSHPQIIGGQIVGAVVAMVDITERKLMEDELRRAKNAAESANRAKSMFLANMSHEIRTPMNGILGFSQLMLGDAHLSDQQRGHLNTINRCGEHLLSLLNDILEMSKIEAGHTTLNPAPFDLHTLIDDLDKMFRLRADTKKISFVVDRIESLPRHVTGDESKLRQVFINLLGNAVKFTENGGVVLRVRVHQDDLHSLRLEAEVEDTGIGILEEEVGRMFQHFEQTQSGRLSGTGTGLGLAISREFVRLMGGDITLRSQFGRGSVFSLSVLLQPAATEPREVINVCRRVQRLNPNQQKFRILIADDKEVNRALLSGLLEPIGFELREAINGIEAVHNYEQWHPDLILMDVIMPIMDGNEAVGEIRRRASDRSVKIITISASTFEEDRSKALEIGADDFIGKPFRQPELLEKIRVLLGAEYIYEDEDAPLKESSIDLAEISLAELPEQLLSQVVVAARLGEFELVTELIAEIAPISPRLANKLGRLAENFDADGLLRLIQATPEGGALWTSK